MLANVRDILIITTPHDVKMFRTLLGNGQQWGISFNYAVQPSPDGLAQAFLIGEDFIGQAPVCLTLGDNIYYGQGLSDMLRRAASRDEGATIFGYYVRDPERYGVVSFDKQGKVTDIEEKPQQPKSHYAVTGLYFYDNQVVDIAKAIKPSPRGELEITDVNKAYLEQGTLTVELMGRGQAWLDTGTHDSLLAAANFMQVVEQRQGQKISCPEEIAFRMGYIDAEQLVCLAKPLAKNGYGEYLLDLLKREA
jgi:glucose-1-phosphate thymidylyltransferase